MSDQAIDWAAVAGNALLIVLAAFGPVLGALAVLTLRRAAARLRLDASTIEDRQVYAACDRAVAAAEEWARRLAVRPSGSAKADFALAVLRDILESRTYREYGEPALRRLLDAAVNDRRDGGGADGTGENRNVPSP